MSRYGTLKKFHGTATGQYLNASTSELSGGGGGAAFDPADPVFHGTGTSVGNSGAGSTTVGPGATTTGTDSVALGKLARAEGNNAVSIGAESDAILAGAIAVGQLAQATGINATAFGQQANAVDAQSSAFGNLAAASLGGTALGRQSTARSNGIAIGPLSQNSVGVDSGVAIGNGAQSRASNTIALGGSAIADGWTLGALGPLAITGPLLVATGAPAGAAGHRLRINLNGVNYTIALSPDE